MDGFKPCSAPFSLAEADSLGADGFRIDSAIDAPVGEFKVPTQVKFTVKITFEREGVQ